MSTALFNAKITLNGANQIDTDIFELQFSVLDALGLFSGLDVSVNDLIYIDTSGYEPGTLSRYKVTSIISQEAVEVTAQVKFDDNNTSVIDPSSGIFIDGFISRPTVVKKLALVPDPQTQGLPNKFAILPQNDNLNQRLDESGGVGWKTYNLYFGSFLQEGNTYSLPLEEVVPGTLVEKVLIKHSIPFVGAGACTMSVGVVADVERFSSAFDVAQEVGDNISQVSITGDYRASTTIIYLTITTETPLNNLTAGAVEIALQTSKI